MGAKSSCQCHGSDDVFGHFEDCPSGRMSLSHCGEQGGDDMSHGVEELQDGSCYEGQFLGHDRHGWGKIDWACGDAYEGQFSHNDMHGQGTLHWSSGITYSGQWRQNELGPLGSMRWPDGRQYRGYFHQGEKHGEGRLMWPDGRSYTGQWSAGKQHGYGFISEGRGQCHLSQWDGGKIARWLPDSTLNDLSAFERARVAVASGAVRLLSAQWLLDQPDGHIISRRQEIPQDAFMRTEDAESLLEKRYGVVVVSAPWLSMQHADPYGFHARTLIKYLDKHLDFFHGFDDIGVFWDFASLHQYGPGANSPGSCASDARSEDELRLRSIGLQSLAFLYGGKKSLVVKLTRMPESRGQHYSSRGWCFVESTMAGLTKDADQLLDLGLAPKLMGDPSVAWEDLRDAVISPRPPPMLPEDMGNLLEKLAFSEGDDRALVLKLYTGFFKEVAPTVSLLSLAHSRPEGGWGDTEVKLLCRALPSFTTCKALSLAHHGNMSRGSLKDLRERLQHMTSLQRLVLPHHLEESKEGQALVKDWSLAGKSPERLVWMRRQGGATGGA